MFYTKQTSISDFLIHGSHVLDFLDSRYDAQGALLRYGFGPTQLQEGRALFNQVQTLNRQVQDLKRKQVAATAAFHTQWKQAKRCYQVHLHAARRALGTDARQLLTPMPGRYSGWLEHATSFYSAALSNPLYQEALGAVNVALDELVQVNELLTTVVSNKETQVQANSNVRLLVQQRQQEMSKSKGWFEVLMGTARVAFQDQPGILAAMIATPVRTEAEKQATRQVRAERRAAKLKAAEAALAQKLAAEPVAS